MPSVTVIGVSGTSVSWTEEPAARRALRRWPRPSRFSAGSAALERLGAGCLAVDFLAGGREAVVGCVVAGGVAVAGEVAAGGGAAVSGDAVAAGGAAGRSVTGIVLIRGSTLWMRGRRRVGRSGPGRAGRGGRRLATAGAAAFDSASRKITSRGCVMLLPSSADCSTLASISASTLSRRRPIDLSLKRRS